MTRRASCACGNEFEVEDDLAGGITNCTRCGKAVEVGGLKDPAWRLLQAAAAAGWACATAAAYFRWGLGGAALTALCLAAILWLVSRAL
ncbi:MAG TPA: hypothetical protein VFY93_11075 [Planctomycetota bacterium]|nr:hypothetical protein [Planctomycetota bacterium]